VFHDITSGNNSVPGQTGFNATAGYDQATVWVRLTHPSWSAIGAMELPLLLFR